MIYCNFCGNAVEDYQSFCGDCGRPSPVAPQPVTPISQAGTPAAVGVPAGAYTQPVAPPSNYIPHAGASTDATTQRPPSRTKFVLLALAGVALVAVIAGVVYFALTPSKTDDVAGNLRSKVRQGTLVSPNGGDAYDEYSKLKTIDPNNPALAEMKDDVLAKLRALGDEVFVKHLRVDGEAVTESDWTRTGRVYQWAHELDPADKTLGARRRFAEAEAAKQQGKRADKANDMLVAESKREEAERGYKAAAESDPSRAVPQNSLGLLIVENVGVNRPKERCHSALEYYRRANQLDPNWEIPYNNMGTAYFILGPNYDAEAESNYRRAVQMNPSWARPHYWLGELYERKGPAWRASALNEYQTAYRLGKDNLPVTAQQLESKIQKLSY
ncbi:MAG TPA: hypothetical protein VFX96_16620 [Pyrinomonadaceae bacterium]|nr:hypothetical protein [Pyrinomonadaceae bacterium]